MKVWEKARQDEIRKIKPYIDGEEFLKFKKNSDTRWKDFATTGNCNMKIDCKSCPITSTHSPFVCSYKTANQKIAMLNENYRA